MAAKKVTVKGFKQTEKDKNFRGETNTTADTARAGNLARVASRAAAKPTKKMTAKPAAKENLIQDITNRFRVTAREARDIVTAVSTAAQYRNSENQGTYKDLKKDVVTQIKEVGKAAVTGKGGTKPSQKYKGVVTRNPGKKGFDNNAPRG